MSSTLKFNLESFKELDAPDLIINVWSYSDHLKSHQNCRVCKTYREYSLKALEKKWSNNWGNFDYVVSRITRNDKNFLDVSKYSSADRFLIIEFLKKIEAARKQFFVKVNKILIS